MSLFFLIMKHFAVKKKAFSRVGFGASSEIHKHNNQQKLLTVIIMKLKNVDASFVHQMSLIFQSFVHVLVRTLIETTVKAEDFNFQHGSSRNL